MSGPMSFPRRFPWPLAVFMFGMPLFIPLIALVWASGPPLRSYYLRSYVESSERGAQPGAKTEIRWVYKIAAPRKPELATEQDVTAHLFNNGVGKNAHAPFQLTAAARSQGWEDVVEGQAVKVPSAPLAAWLKREIYGGEGLWWLMFRPFLWGSGGLVPFARRAGMVEVQSEARGAPRAEDQRAGAAAGFPLARARADGIGFRLRFESPLLRWLPFGPSYDPTASRVQSHSACRRHRQRQV